MNIKVWSNFSKRRNSTKQPTGGTTVTCVLKETTSIEKPTFVFSSNDFSINYVEAFGHYYFVDDIKSVRNNIIEVSCSQDVLATYKSSITGSSQYVERAAGATAPVNVGDPLNPPSNVVSVKRTTILNLTTVDSSGINKIIDFDALNGKIVNHYILGITGDSGVNYWGLDELELAQVMEAIFGSSWIGNFASLFFGYKDCILSLKRVTYPPGGTPQQIIVGHEPLTLNGAPVKGIKISDLRMTRDSGLVTISFPADDYLNIRSYPYYKPYSFATLTLPFVGVVEVDVNDFAGDGKLGVEVFVDPFTADIIYKVRRSDGALIGTYTGNCGADLPISGQTFNSIGMAAGILNMTAGLMTAATFGGAGATGIIAGAGQIFEGARLHAQTNGCLSSFIGGYASLIIYADVYTNEPTSWTIENMKTTQGVIVNRQRSLSGLSGYVKCKNASIDIPGFEEDKETIQSFMNSGFYIE